jgi:hypothetical protein
VTRNARTIPRHTTLYLARIIAMSFGTNKRRTRAERATITWRKCPVWRVVEGRTGNGIRACATLKAPPQRIASWIGSSGEIECQLGRAGKTWSVPCQGLPTSADSDTRPARGGFSVSAPRCCSVSPCSC